MKRIFSFICLSLLLAGTVVYAQTDKLRPARKERAGINLSLWKNLATQRTDTVGSTFLNLGIFSAMNRPERFGSKRIGFRYGQRHERCAILRHIQYSRRKYARHTGSRHNQYQR